jgi:hypothetical protein
VPGMRISSLVNHCWKGWSPSPCLVAFRHPNSFIAHQLLLLLLFVVVVAVRVLCGRYEETFPGESLLERLVTFSLPCGLQAPQSIQCPPICCCCCCCCCCLLLLLLLYGCCVPGMSSSSLVNPCWNGWSPSPYHVACRHPNAFSAHQFVVVVVVVVCCCSCCTGTVCQV